MSQPTLTIFNPLEEVLSTDLTRVGGLAGQAVMDRWLAATGGISNSATPPSVVPRGLNASPGAGLQTSIDTGDLFQFVAGVVPNQSQYKLGQNLAAAAVVHVAADPVNPRIDRISCSINTVDTDVVPRNELVLPGRTVNTVNVAKTRNPNIVFTVTAGVPAASPVAPATPAGQVAIWDVYIPANAVSILDNNLMDLRVRFHPWALAQAHVIEHGLSPSTSAASLTSLTFPAGRGWANGGLLDMLASQTVSHANLTNNGTGALASTEYHLYAVVKGSGDPVGKNIADNVVLVVSMTAPGADGRPSSPILYRPFFNQAPLLNNVIVSSTNALYLGTIHTDGASNYEAGGSGIPFSKDGTAMIQNVDPVGNGWCGLSSGWVKKPTLSWVDANTINIGQCAPVIAGQVGVFFAQNAGFPGALFPGDVRAGTRFWYVYLRRAVAESAVPGSYSRGAIRTYVVQISREAPNAFLGKPTPQAPFASQEYLFVGSFLDVGGAAIRQFYRRGEDVYWIGANDGVNAGAVNTEAARSAITVPNMPATSLLTIAEMTLRVLATAAANGQAALVGFNVYGSVGSASPIYQPEVIATCFDTTQVFIDGDLSARIPLSGAALTLNQFEASINAPTGTAGRVLAATAVTNQVIARFVGYVEDIERLG